jgi:uncharacterized protein YjdB
VDAVFADGVTRPTRINWDSPSISQSIAGIYTVHGVSAVDSTKTVEFQLEVVYRPVTGITLSQNLLYLRSSGTSYRNATLTATVEPPDAFDPSVNWTTSNAAVATVADGTVQGVGAGTAVITATSVTDPGCRQAARCMWIRLRRSAVWKQGKSVTATAALHILLI